MPEYHSKRIGRQCSIIQKQALHDHEPPEDIRICPLTSKCHYTVVVQRAKTFLIIIESQANRYDEITPFNMNPET